MIKLFKGCLTFVGGIILLIVVAALFWGGEENSSADSGGDSSLSSSAQNKDSAPIGTLTEVRGDRALLVQRSEIVDSIFPGNQYVKPVEAKGGKLVIVFMTLNNTGQESGDMIWTTFQLIDNQGRKYDAIQDLEEIVSIDMWLESQGLQKASSQLFPGATAQTAKVFRVAPDASDLKMVVNQKSFNIQ